MAFFDGLAQDFVNLLKQSHPVRVCQGGNMTNGQKRKRKGRDISPNQQILSDSNLLDALTS